MVNEESKKFDIFKNESHLESFKQNEKLNWQSYGELEFSNTNKARAIAQKGLMHLKKGDKKIAIKELNQAWSIDPTLDKVGVLLILNYIDEKNYSIAHQIAKELQTNVPNNAQGFILDGVIYGLEGEFVKSQASYFDAIKIEPGSPSANHNLAAYAINIKDFDKARAFYQAVLKFHSEHVQTLIKLARLENQIGDEKEAFKFIDQAISLKPEELEPRVVAAHFYLLAGKPRKALDVIDPLLEKNGSSEILFEIIGRAQLLAGNPKQAAENFLKWTKQSPAEKWSFYYLAEALGKLKLIDHGVVAINKAIDLDNDKLLFQFSKAKLLIAKRQLKEAKNILLSVMKANDNNFNGYVAELQGRIALAEGRADDAIKSFEIALSHRETNFIAIKLAVAYVLAGQEDKAYAILIDWLGKYPDDTFSKIALADIYLKQGELEKARVQYQYVLDDQPRNSYVLNNTAWLLEQKGRNEEALVLAERAYKIAPKNVNIIDTLGNILIKTQKIDRGVRLLRAGLEKSPDNNSLKYNLSLGLIQKGNVSEAKAILHKIAVGNSIYQERATSKLAEIK